MELRHVVIIANQASIMGGAEKVACRTAVLMARRGLDVHLFTAVGPVSPELIEAGVNVVCLNQDYIAAGGRAKVVAALQGLWNTKAKRELSKLLVRLDPATTVVNLHSWTHTMSASILQVVRNLRFPLLVTAHDYFLACPNGGFYNYVDWKPCELRCCDSECRCINCDKRNYLQKKYRVARFNIQTNILKKMESKIGVIFLSKFSENVLRKSIPFEYEVFHVDNPIEQPDNEGRSVPGYDDRAIDCLFVGRLEPEKDPELFCRAVTSAGCRAVVVGDGAQREQLEREFPGISFVGRKSADEVRAYYRNSRIFAFSSSYYEVAPLTIREAQISGALPVVLRGGTAGEDYVRDGVDGIVVPYDDGAAFADAIVRLLDKGTNDAMRGSAASADYSNHRDDVYADRMESIYKAFLGTGSDARFISSCY